MFTRQLINKFKQIRNFSYTTKKPNYIASSDASAEKTRSLFAYDKKRYDIYYQNKEGKS